MLGKTLVVSSCGTSLLTNRASGDLGGLLRRTTNDRGEELAPEDKKVLDARIEECARRLEEGSLQEARDLSAELNGLLGFYEDQLLRGKDDELFFVHTDTYQGECVAELLRAWGAHRGLKASTFRVSALNTKRLEDFHEGMGHLVEWCQETLPGYRESGYRVVFNLVGGFKTLQGFMQTLGMFFADESVYVFEGERKLLRIPRLPVDLDAGARKIMRERADMFRRMAWTDVPLASCTGLPETLLYVLGDVCELSPWGKLLWGSFRRELYGEAILPAPSPKIRLTKNFLKMAEDCGPDERRLINERLDDLAHCVEMGFNPKRLSFKALEEKSSASHQFYLWSGSGAGRAFGHFEGETFVVDDMTPTYPKNRNRQIC